MLRFVGYPQGAFDYGSGKQTTPNKTQSVGIVITIRSGATADNLVFRPQLETGTTATAYTPYVSDLTAVQVTRSGKNLFDAANAAKVSGASGFTNANGVITVTQSKAEKWASANVPISPGLVGSTITITCKSVVSGINKAGVRVQWVASAGGAAGDMILGNPDGDGNIAVTGVVPHQPDESHNILCLMLYSNTNGTLASGTVYTATYSDIQLETGTTATAYTPYQAQTYTPAADGTVSGVTSLSPDMTLMTDKVGVVLDVTYNRDINAAFAQLQQAILSLGGNV